jgi:hypothetical protein
VEVIVTEQQWLLCADPLPMLDLLRRRAGDRKVRLFACACCRLVWEHLPTQCLPAVELAERYADGAAGAAECAEARRRLNALIAPWRGAGARLAQAVSELLRPRFSAALVATRARTGPERGTLPGRQCELLRDLHTFRPVRGQAAWRTADVCRLAQGMYQQRDFERLPVLGDALEEAGCAEPSILAHCRGPGLHALGCWVLDLVLARD